MGLKLKKYLLSLLTILIPIGESHAAGSVTQPYRPLNETQQWTIEGQNYGLLKVRVLINGQEVANGEMKSSPFSSSYNGRPVRVTCTIGKVKWSTGGDLSCAVYVDNELAANLIFKRNS